MKSLEHAILTFIVGSILLLAIFLLGGCKTCQCLPEVITRDSIRVEYQRDSIYAHDSIFIDRYKAGDTVYLTKERWSIRYRDVLHTDTCYVDHNTVEVKTERYVPPFYKFCLWFFIVVCLAIICTIAFKVVKLIYL